MSGFSSFAIPALVALALKVVLLVIIRIPESRNKATTAFLFLTLFFGLQNVAELYVYHYSGPQDELPINMLSGYFYLSFSVAAIGLICHLGLILSNEGGKVSNRELGLIYGPMLLLQILLWSGTTLVAGFEPIGDRANGFKYTRSPGPLYPLFSIYTIYCLTTSLIAVTRRAFDKFAVPRRRKNCIFYLVGIGPTAVFAIAVVVLQQLELNIISTPMYLPILISFFLFVMGYAIFDLRIFSLSFKLPAQIESGSSGFRKSIQSYLGDAGDIVSSGQLIEQLSYSLKRPVALVTRDDIVESNKLSPVSTPSAEQLLSVEQIWISRKEHNPSKISEQLDQSDVGVIYPITTKEQKGWLIFFRDKVEDRSAKFDTTSIEDLMANLSDNYLEDLIAHRNEIDHTQQHIESVGSQISELEQRLKALEKENSKLRSNVGSNRENDRD